jgi:hypothetical protein
MILVNYFCNGELMEDKGMIEFSKGRKDYWDRFYSDKLTKSFGVLFEKFGESSVLPFAKIMSGVNIEIEERRLESLFVKREKDRTYRTVFEEYELGIEKLINENTVNWETKSNAEIRDDCNKIIRGYIGELGYAYRNIMNVEPAWYKTKEEYAKSITPLIATNSFDEWADEQIGKVELAILDVELAMLKTTMRPTAAFGKKRKRSI